MRLLIIILGLFFSSCATTHPIPGPEHFTSQACRASFISAYSEPADQQINRISKLFKNRCYQETISLGNYLRNYHRDKIYEVTTETAEIFTPDGSLTPYVLESYERTYLSLLLAVSYMNINKKDEGLVELRRSIDEEKAVIYNYGSDPVLSLLQAAIWDHFDTSISRPFWKTLGESPSLDTLISIFAKNRLQEIDLSPSKTVDWKIYEVGEFPKIEWESDLFTQKEGPYKISAARSFPMSCSTSHSVLMPTDSWVKKISHKYNSQYHPLLYTKSLARVPVALAYGVAGTVGGVALSVGGCILGAGLHSGEVCGYAVQGGASIIKKSTNFAENTMAPDLRRWKTLPEAFLIIRNDSPDVYDECLDQGQKLLLNQLK